MWKIPTARSPPDLSETALPCRWTAQRPAKAATCGLNGHEGCISSWPACSDWYGPRHGVGGRSAYAARGASSEGPDAFEPRQDSHPWVPYTVHGPDDSDRRPVDVREGDQYLSVDDVADGLVVVEVSSCSRRRSGP